MIGRELRSESEDEEEVVADDDVAEAVVKLAERGWGRVRWLGMKTDVAMELRLRRDILVIVPLVPRRPRISLWKIIIGERSKFSMLVVE